MALGVHQPEPDRALISRPRLVARLAQRFERRLTIVVGGGGAGKTTLLTQAVSGTDDHLDVVHACVPSDRTHGRLLAGLHAAATATLGGDPHATESVAAIAELVLSRSPQQVCLLLDDTHKLDRFDLVDELLDELPANGHLLLAGRQRPAVDTARLDAAGELVEIAQDDLLMTLDEQIEFANLRGIDVAVLEGAEGWPAFVELASTGSEVRSRRYLEEEALRGLSAERRTALSRFAHVGGGDDEIAEATTGVPLDSLVADLPLVRWERGEARLHDLWGELLGDCIDDAARRDAALAAADVHRARGRFDRALDLCRAEEAWDEAAETLGAALVESMDGGLMADRLRRWRAVLPPQLDGAPEVALLDGLIERESDPTSETSWERIETAAAAFEETDRHELTLAALLQLGYIGRIRGDNDLLGPVMDRIQNLAERHSPALPFLAFGRAWAAMAQARSDVQLRELEAIAHEELPHVWSVTRDHLIAHGLMSLGRPLDGLERVPREVETLPVAIPGALVTESQCLWYGGHPEEALRRRPGDTSARYGARDRFIAGAWNAMMFAYAGDVTSAREAMRVATESAGEAPSAVVATQTIGLAVITKIAEDQEDEAAGDVEAILEFAPLGSGPSEQAMRNNVAPSYVLAPQSREFWEKFDFGPSQREALSVIRAFARWRDGEPAAVASLRWPTPGRIAAQLPCVWAIELALAGLSTGRHEGRRLAAWLCEHWGEPARAALRRWVDDDTLGAVAREVLSSTPTPPRQPTSLHLLGSTTVKIDGFVNDGPDLRRERVRALLALLALKPHTTRDALAGTLWPDQPADKAAKNLRTTLAYVHGLLEPRRSTGDAPWYVRIDGHRVRLHHSLEIDADRFGTLLDEADRAERAGRPHTALPLMLEAIELWNGDLAEDLDAEWLDLERIHLRSRFVRAACRASELLLATRDPGRAAALARRALDVDPWNEYSYLALADAYDEMGDHTSARAVRKRGEDAVGAPIEPRRRPLA